MGRSYAINTIGAIAGAFLTGFISDSENQHEVHAVICCGDVLSGSRRLAYRPG